MGERIVFDLISDDNFLMGNISIPISFSLLSDYWKNWSRREDQSESRSSGYSMGLCQEKEEWNEENCKYRRALSWSGWTANRFVLTSNSSQDNEAVPICRRLKNDQGITIDCWKAVKWIFTWSWQLSERMSIAGRMTIFIYFVKASISFVVIS